MASVGQQLRPAHHGHEETPAQAEGTHRQQTRSPAKAIRRARAPGRPIAALQCGPAGQPRLFLGLGRKRRVPTVS